LQERLEAAASINIKSHSYWWLASCDCYAQKIKTNMKNIDLKQISLIQELELGVETVKSGLSIIQSMKLQKTPSFLIFLILSTGLERILKVVIGMRLLSDNKPFPSEKELRKNYGHNLISLRNEVLNICYKNKKEAPPIISEDYNFIKDNVILNELLTHLSEFARKDRYVYMNRISNENSTGKWLSLRWEEIENKIVSRGEAIELIQNNRNKEYIEIVSKSLVKCIERFLSALARTITLGKMDKNSNSAGTLLYDFLFIRESQLGTRKYDLFGYSTT
jgi:hypothetical protein